MKERLLWIDVAKGIGILAVIAGHMKCPILNRLVFPWHMPLFFILAGYFVNDKGTLRDFVAKKAKSLLAPYILTSVAVIVGWTLLEFYSGDNPFGRFCEGIVASLYGAGSRTTFLFDGIRPIGAIWFLEALFWGLIIVRISGAKWWIVLLISALSCWSARYIWLPLNIQSGGLASAFIYCGRFLCRRTDVFERANLWLCVLGVICFVYSAVLDPELYLVVNACSLPNIIASFFIVYLVCQASRWTAKVPQFSSLLSFYGRNSLLILCLHLFELNCMPWCALRRIPGWENLYFQIPFLLFLKVVFVTIGVAVAKRMIKLLTRDETRPCD